MNLDEKIENRVKRLKELNIPFPQNIKEFSNYSCELFRNTKYPAIYLEIGSRHGGSLFFAADFLPKKSKIISIDLPNYVWGIKNSDIMLEKICNELTLEGYECYRIIANSKDESTLNSLKEILKGEKIDAVFADGDHSIEGISSDWINYSPFVKENGIFGFHDIRNNEKYPKVEVSILWEQLKKVYPYMEIVFEHGIGLIWKTELK